MDKISVHGIQFYGYHGVLPEETELGTRFAVDVDLFLDLREAGLSDDEVALMCEIASVVDAGTFESAGFTFSIDTWHPGGDCCCHLHIRPGE